MNIQIISCGVFRTDLQKVLSDHPQFDILYLEGGLHNNPEELRFRVQEAINQTEDIHEKIVILYGVCGQGISGLYSEKSTLVIPRVHDCISLFLGSGKAYQEQFRRYPGTYYISAGWYDEQIQPIRNGLKKTDSIIHSGREGTHNQAALEKKYGPENAKWIMDFYGSWKKNYKRAVFINTDSGKTELYREHANAMAREFGWKYQEINGSADLIIKAVFSTGDDNEILQVPPGHITYYDNVLKRIASAPLENKETSIDQWPSEKFTMGEPSKENLYRYGLGIDAGGTYTDAVIYDFMDEHVVSTGKALTTKWDYTVGIVQAVKQLGMEYIRSIEMVSVSTTLATNAIVEGNTQPVGLLMMNIDNSIPKGISCFPRNIIKGKTTIQGVVEEEIDPEEILTIANMMIKEHGIRAFAVSGYAGTVNPVLEQRVKEILHTHTGMDICCGHELSGLLDYTLRANTAVLNAGIIPLLESFIINLEEAMAHLDIDAPIMIVKGDGTLISTETAKLHPIQTALSGPAASTAGAKYLTGISDATIIDVGGTTSDIGIIRNGRISVGKDGVSIGGIATHVRAVDMLTLGIGGDSEIKIEKRELTVGPKRVVPFSSLSAEIDLGPILRILENEVRLCKESTQPISIIASTGRIPDFELTPGEERILDVLSNGPVSVNTLSVLINSPHWSLLSIRKLELNQIIRRSSLTPTDIFQANGELTLWDTSAAEKITDLFASILDITREELIYRVKARIQMQMSRALTRRFLLPETGNHDSTNISKLIDTIWKGGTANLKIVPELSHPVIGLGAAAEFVLPDTVSALNGELVIHRHSAVANAIGAITSKVQVKRTGSIVPSPTGEFSLVGISGCPSYETLELAQEILIQHLAEEVKSLAEAAGTGNREVFFTMENRMAEDAAGNSLFLEKIIKASITGLPILKKQR